tara:strand:- start:149 stop:310 length:162 start_codon:yes stop_codon:yes gene_type:complete
VITEQTIKEFQEVVRSEYGAELELDVARSVLQNWASYFDLLAKINHRIKTESE